MKPTSTLEVAFVPSLFSAHSILLALSLLSAAPAVLPAQQVLDYDHSVLAAPPAYGYPLYTPGAGSLGQTVRTQFLCPESFLTAQSIGAGLVTHIGLSLAGEATYDTFVLRAGTSTVTALTNTWDQNLPDQRVQKDLSHVLLRGGGTATAPASQWVEFELEYPFFYVTGQSIVVDLTAHLAVPGALLGTTVGTSVERAFTLNYQGGPMANTLQAAGGLAFRMRFAPLDVVPYGSGCPGTGSFVPRLTSTGACNLGSTNFQLEVDRALPNALGGFLLGFSRSTFVGGALPYAWGGGCEQLTSGESVVGVYSAGTGPGGGTATLPMLIPNWPSLIGAVFYAQYAQLDVASPASVPVVFSNAGAIVIY